MNKEKNEDLINEIGKNVHEFFLGEVRLNSAELSADEIISLMMSCGFDIFINSLINALTYTDKTLYQLYETLGFDKKVKEISEKFENNK